MKTLYSIATVCIITLLGFSVKDKRQTVHYNHEEFESVSKRIKKAHDSIIRVNHAKHGE